MVVLIALVDPQTTMIYSFIRGMLGTTGDILLDFYIANSLWINALILLYAILVAVARHTFDMSRRSVIAFLESQYGQQFEQKKPGSVLKVLHRINIPWDQALGQSGFPFMTPPGSIWIYPKNSATFQRLLPLEKLAELLMKP